MSFMTVPTPLYGLYSAKNGFSDFTITIIFAAYGAGVLIGLLLLGHVSDHIGRKPILLGSILVQIGCAAAFAALTGTDALIVLRLVTGLCVGVFSTAATAALTELYSSWRPDGRPALAQTVANTANLGGLAGGPLVAGAIYAATDSITAPYLVYVGLLTASLLAVALAPESVPRTAGDERWHYRPQAVRVDPQVRTPFLGAAVAAFAGFAVLGFITALTGQFLAHVGTPSALTTGVVATTVLTGGIVSQWVFARASVRRRLTVGAGLMAGGALLIGAAALAGSLPLYLVGGFLASGGNGLAFSSAVATVIAITPAQTRGATLAALFLAAYTGTTVPVIAIGALLLSFGMVSVTVAFAILIAITVPAGIAILVRNLHGSL